MSGDELQQGQDQLAAAIHQARAGDDRQLSQRVREQGEQVVRLMVGLLRLCAIHDPENHAFDEPTHQLVNALLRLEKLVGPVSVVCVEGQVYVNDIRIRMDDRLTGPAALEHELGRHGCGGLSFSRPLDDEQVRALAHCVAGPPAEAQPLHGLVESLRACGCGEVFPLGRFRLRVSGEAPRNEAQKEFQRTLTRANQVVADAWSNLGENRTPNPLPIRRLVNDVVDASGTADILGEGEQLENMGTGSSEFARHSVRVTTFAVLIGRELGLSPASMADLGVAAMYHDAGYALKDDDGFAPAFSHHGTAGVRALGRQRGFHQAKIKRMLVALQHHWDLDRTPCLYARIVRIADDFENYTRVRPTGALMSPAEALVRMASAVGSAYDPHLFQLFVNRVGAFPPGTLLRLRDGRVAMSLSGARDPGQFSRPACRVLRRADGTLPGPDERVDTAEPGCQIAEVLLQKR